MGTEEQTGGNKPNQTNQPGQKGTPNPQHEQRKDRDKQPGGQEKGTGQQGGGMPNER